MDPASDRIQTKVHFGLLPFADPVKMWLGQGGGSSCDGCDAALTPTEGQVELQFADEEVIRMHQMCAEIWLALKGDLIEDAAADLSRRDQAAAPKPRLAKHLSP